jgi:uncharacterized cupin superfamily protein
MHEIKERRYLVRAEEISEGAARFSHPRNHNSEGVGTRLGALTGLLRTGVNWVRVPASKEPLVYYSHYRKEE